MAFNPFSVFRRFSKVGMAFLAIMCMLLFVLSGSGFTGGDALDQLMTYLQFQRKEARVAELYGASVYRRELETVRQQRAMANAYVHRNLDAAQQQIAAELQKYTTEPTGMASVRGAITEVLQAHQETATQLRFAAIFEQRLPPAMRDEQRRAQMTLLDGARGKAMRARQDLTDDKAAERALLLKGEALLLSDAVLVWRGSSQSYFGGTLDEEGVLDFMIWLKQADKLGVKFSADDVGEELKQETLRNLSELPVDKKAEIYQSMQSDFRGLTQTTLAEALGNEFRVRAVQVAMTGTWGGLPPRTDTAPPTWLTPYSFYRDYRDARTTMQVSLLPVQAEKFLDKVSGTPTPNELQEMYDRYKDVEPNPASPTPGFKQPRQVAVQWVNILGETDYFRKKAEEAEKFARAAGQALAGVGVEGGGFIGPASQAAVPVLFDPVELKEYADYVRRAEQRKAAVTDFWGAGFSDTGALAESSFLAPDAPNRKGWPSALAGFTGQLLGQTGTGVPGHLAAVSLPTQAFARELYDRALTGATTVGVVVGGVDHPFAGLGLPMTAVVRPLPFEKVSPLLKRDAIRETLASRKRDADIRELTEELTKRRSKTGPDGRAGLADYVAKWIAERGLQTGTTTQPRSRFTIRLDPGMKPLLSAYEVFARTNDPTLDGFGRPFFDEGPSGVTGLYSVQPFSVGFGEPMYYFWRTEDQAPRVLPLEAKKPGEPQAKEAVETAWRLDKARALAEAEAKKLAEGAAKDAAGDVKKLRDLANAAGAELIELDNVARQVPTLDRPPLTPTSFRMPRTYRPYELPAGRIPFPTQDFVTQLLALREKPVGAVEVLPDSPRTRFYVTVLTKKEVPELTDTADPANAFSTVWSKSVPGEQGQDLFRAVTIGEQAMEYSRDVLKQLRTEAKLKIEAPANRERRGEGEPVE